LNRANFNGDIPEPYIWVAAAEYLLRRHLQVDRIRAGLSQMNRRELSDAAIMALEHLPDLAVDLFRKALRSKVPLDRTKAAAALAILDQPWSREELISVLLESNDQIATSDCRAALCMLSDTVCHEMVRAWEIKNPRAAETGPFISQDEMALRHCDSFMAYQMESLHDQILPLRNIKIDHVQRKRRWWPF
jgi:hypothetical protein